MKTTPTPRHLRAFLSRGDACAAIAFFRLFFSARRSAGLLLLRVACLAALCGPVRILADTSLAACHFENSGDASAWVTGGGSSTLAIVGNADVLPVNGGSGCLQFAMDGTATGTRYVRNSAMIPVTVAATPPTPRRIAVSLALRSQDFGAGDLVVRVLEQTDGGVSHWIMDTEDFLTVPASRQWVQFSKIAWLRDDTTRLYVYIYALDGANSTGTLWVDDLQVTALDANSDYLVEAVSGEPGNVFQADTGGMTVNLYDPRTASLGVTVLDHTGAPAPAGEVTITSLTSRKKQVTFNEKGCYTVQATITPSGGGSVVKTWPVAVIGAPVTPAAPFGFFSVNSDNPLAVAAGARWNRYFIHFRNVTGSGGTYHYTGSADNAAGAWLSGSAGTTTNSMLYLPESVDHTWIACLDGIPDELLPAGKTAANRRQWEYFGNKDAFKAMLKWVLEDLPPFVEYVETCNEPEWGNWGGTWDQLGDYIKTIKDVVDEVNTEMPGRSLKLIGPVFAHLSTVDYPDADTDPDSSYGFASKYLLLDNLLNTQGVAASLDGIAMHAYVDGSAPEGRFLTRLDGFRSYLVGIGAGSLPVYLSEFGWQSGNPGDWQPPVTEAEQANYTARAWLLLLSRAADYHIDAALSFCLLHGASGGLDHYSFLNLDSTPRLPFAAYARTAREVAPCTADRRYLSMGADVRAFTAVGGGDTLLVLWTASAASRVVPVPAASASARGLYGHPVTLGTTVTATESPVFITVADAALGAYTEGASYSMSPGDTITAEFSEMVCAPIFSLSGTHFHVSSTAAAGAYKILGRVGSVWKAYSITVD